MPEQGKKKTSLRKIGKTKPAEIIPKLDISVKEFKANKQLVNNKAAQIERPLSFDEYKENFVKQMMQLNYRHRVLSAFEDFVTMEAYALANLTDKIAEETGILIDRKKVVERELLIDGLLEKYHEPTDQECFKECSRILITSLEHNRRDLLGEVYMELGLGNASQGQFFTPNPIAVLMAALSLPMSRDCEEVKRNGYITICDPTSGSSGLLISACELLRDRGFHFFDYFVTAIDISKPAYFMSYIQLSHLYIPACVVWGDSLLNKTFEMLYTPAAILNSWKFKKELFAAE